MKDSKVVLITGAAKRIGASIARTFHANGYRVLIHANNSKDEAIELCFELNKERVSSANALFADFNCHEETLKIATDALNYFGRIDVLINNASMFYPSSLAQAKTTDWDKLFNSNVRAAFFLSQSLAKELSERSGCIINIVDTHADKPLKDHAVYCMAKSALKSMTKSLSLELAPRVRVNGISPGAILWPTEIEEEVHDKGQQKKNAILDSIPLTRLGDPQDISNLAYFFAEEGDYITGQVVKVDGGRSLV